jgi:hypothetical protein
MRELLLRMQDVNTQSFSIIANKITEEAPDSLTKFWEVLAIRNEERAEAWKHYLSGNGSIPEPLL